MIQTVFHSNKDSRIQPLLQILKEQGWYDVGLSGNEPPKTKTNESFLETEPGQYYICESYFNIQQSDAEGGAVSFDPSDGSTTSQILIESTVFDNCHTTAGIGGAIASFGGSFVINKCCSNNCSSIRENSNGQFTYLYNQKKQQSNEDTWFINHFL